jgi:hypothetical protein
LVASLATVQTNVVELRGSRPIYVNTESLERVMAVHASKQREAQTALGLVAPAATPPLEWQVMRWSTEADPEPLEAKTLMAWTMQATLMEEVQNSIQWRGAPRQWYPLVGKLWQNLKRIELTTATESDWLRMVHPLKRLEQVDCTCPVLSERIWTHGLVSSADTLRVVVLTATNRSTITFLQLSSWKAKALRLSVTLASDEYDRLPTSVVVDAQHRVVVQVVLGL